MSPDPVRNFAARSDIQSGFSRAIMNNELSDV